jgi:uncharacterized sporulation protein YeaH/YhbH (DUF444 family)
MTITDKRKAGKNKSVGNRQKFLKRYKGHIKRSVEKISSDKGITDVLKDRKVTVDKDSIHEPNFNFDLSTGERDLVFPGNKNKSIGDRIYRPEEGEGQGTEGSEEGEGTDDFTFTLTKEEFLDLYFNDMCLPDFIKESLKGSTKTKWKRTGYSKDGIPPRLDLVKTLKQGMARRIATKKVCEFCNAEEGPCWKCSGTGIKQQRYLDDIDLRYKHFTKQPFPIRQATMICLMDVSGSMEEFEKTLAKKFFLLLYLFLHKVYKTVDVIFVSHTEAAKEVTEQEFFHGQETGGTIVSSGLELVNNIIDKRIDLATTNVYISQASDGDNWGGDEELSATLLEQLLGKVQYFAYIQTEDRRRRDMKIKYEVKDLMHLYQTIASSHKNLQARHVTQESDVYPVLRSLFEEDKK